MNVAIYGKKLVADAGPYIRDLIGVLETAGAGIWMYEPFFHVLKDHISVPESLHLFYHHQEIRSDVDVFLSFGGDGTLLDTITLVRDSGIPILGINMGRLGFLSSISRDEIIPSVAKILKHDFTLDCRTLLRLESSDGSFGDVNYALNDITFSKLGNLTMITIHAFINDLFMNSYWGDGLIISTPTGSTAYSMSCGGPIISPGSETFLITPVATHNLTVRPVIIPDSSVIRIKVENRNDVFNLSLDSRSISFEGPGTFTIRKEDFKINLIRMEGQDFFRTIRGKLNWGVDNRN